MPSFLQYEFMQNALVSGVVIALVAPILGIFLIIRRYTLISDTLAHSALSGVIIGLFFHISPIITTMLYSLFSATLIEKLRETKKLTGDMVLALFLATNLAFVAIALSMNNRIMLSISSYLFGSISLVSRQETRLLIGGAIFVLGVFFMIKSPLIKTTYDEDGAKASGIKTERINLIFMLLTALTLSIALPIIGFLLLGSLLVLPIVAAVQISYSFSSTLVIAEIISLVSVLSGIILSYYIDISGSGITTLFLVGFFIIFFLYSKLSKAGKTFGQ